MTELPVNDYCLLLLYIVYLLSEDIVGSGIKGYHRIWYRGQPWYWGLRAIGDQGRPWLRGRWANVVRKLWLEGSRATVVLGTEGNRVGNWGRPQRLLLDAQFAVEGGGRPIRLLSIVGGIIALWRRLHFTANHVPRLYVSLGGVGRLLLYSQ